MSKLDAYEVIEELYRDRGRGVKSRKVAPCPSTCVHAHEDNNPSFSVSQKGGKLLFHCLAGRCTQLEAMKGLQDLGILSRQSEDIPPPPLPHASTKPMREWVYRNGNGIAIAIHGRWDTPQGKEIRWRVPDGDYHDGLGELKTEDIPLYGTELLESRPDETVVFCEGESAVDACREHGLLAITNPGGAGQRRFGSSLEILRNRNVELFPDNDPPGRLLMQTIQASLRPIASSVSVLNPGKNIPYKGDAVEFFGMGGTLEELRTRAEPTIEHIDHDQIRLSIPVELQEMRGDIVFLFENIRPAHGKLESDVTITPPVSPIISENHEVHRHVNLKSSSGVTALTREVKTAIQGVDWAPLISRAVSLATRAIFDSTEDAPIDLAASNDEEPQTWLINGLIPSISNVVMFGAGGSLKSISLQSLMMSAVLGRSWAGFQVNAQEHRVLILDYENTRSTWLRYQKRLSQGLALDAFPENKLRYLSMNGVPLIDKYESVQRAIRKNAITLLLIDSAGLAVGGDPSDSYATLQYFNILQKFNDLGVTTLTIAHVTKNGITDRTNAPRQPYGSTYWHNSSRATYFVQSEKVDNKPDLYSLTFACRKMNLGPEPQDFTMQVQFTDPEGPIYIEKGDLKYAT